MSPFKKAAISKEGKFISRNACGCRLASRGKEDSKMKSGVETVNWGAILGKPFSVVRNAGLGRGKIGTAVLLEQGPKLILQWALDLRWSFRVVPHLGKGGR